MLRNFFFILFLSILILSSASLVMASPQDVSQTRNPLKLVFPSKSGWNVVSEGQKLEFQVKAIGDTTENVKFSIVQGKLDKMSFDSTGLFSWVPDYDFTDRLASEGRTIQLLFQAKDDKNRSVSQVVEFKVNHVNRPPVVEDLKPFYVRYNTQNTYTIESSMVKDPDLDPIVFVPVLDAMPEGAKLSAQGEFTWKPSLAQFNQLRKKPIVLEFYVEDQPSKARTKGSFKIEVTQQDLPPSIQMVPSQKRFVYNEDATISLMFKLYDPNGENDIASFSFVSENPNVPLTALVKNTPTQYEFIWKPGYDFVKDPLDSVTFKVTFYALDKSNKQEERTVTFSIRNVVNEEEIDRKLYNEYRATLVKAWDLIEQLKDTEKDLKKKYDRARKGKKGRSLANATLGAITGITPVIIDAPATSKKITTIGGTTVMTIGTLEATEVIGRSTKELVERLNYVIEKKNELQTKGDIFARKNALKSTRRKPEFLKEVDELVALMNLKGLVALELDAGWRNKSKPTDENISRTFKDFSGSK
jgi:hypothetical protein